MEILNDPQVQAFVGGAMIGVLIGSWITYALINRAIRRFFDD